MSMTDKDLEAVAALLSLDNRWRFLKWMSSPLRFQVVRHLKRTRVNGTAITPLGGGRVMRKKYKTLAEAEAAANVRNAADSGRHFYKAGIRTKL